MKIRLTLEIDLDEDLWGNTESERLWLENEVLVADGSLILHSMDVGDEVGKIKKVSNIQWIEPLPEELKEYICTDCKTINMCKDNHKITVGYCSNCQHPLWN